MAILKLCWLIHNLKELDVLTSPFLLYFFHWSHDCTCCSTSPPAYTEKLLTAAAENPVLSLLFSLSRRGPLTTQPSTVLTAYGPFPWLLTTCPGFQYLRDVGTNQHVNICMYAGDLDVREVRWLWQLFLWDNVIGGHRHFSLCENFWKIIKVVTATSKPLKACMETTFSCPMVAKRKLVLLPLMFNLWIRCSGQNVAILLGSKNA